MHMMRHVSCKLTCSSYVVTIHFASCMTTFILFPVNNVICIILLRLHCASLKFEFFFFFSFTTTTPHHLITFIIYSPIHHPLIKMINPFAKAFSIDQISQGGANALSTSQSHQQQKQESSLTDCHFFMTASCNKGNLCQFRHPEAAKKAGPFAPMCDEWTKYNCWDLECPNKHPARKVCTFVSLPLVFDSTSAASYL
mmetsp:Transcript_1740/g.6111  ORF Transcript_1740/g.6111 Transcript_1740/m.6111 type:complete len:197 (+) Transcript_1740:864-1454(+)